LLRTLECGEILPVGSDEAIRVDVRLIAATNRDLLEAVQQGGFRADLLYRINVVELTLPLLRDRREDILPLAKHFAREYARATMHLSPQAAQYLLTHSWPGNVRELRNAIHRACLLCQGDILMPEHLRSAASPEKTNNGAMASNGCLSQLERATILATLEECGGNRTRAAKVLGISRRTLINKLRVIRDARHDGGN
jgi:DNA-binding NtrC family response regulator